MMRFNKILDDITVYEAGKPIELVVREFGIEPSRVVKLASNENPNGCSPKALKAIEANAHKMYLYPDDSYHELKNALAAKHGVKASQIIVGAGSDQVLEFVTKAKLDVGDKVLMSSVTFAMYEIYAKMCGAKIIRTDGPLHDATQFKKLYAEHKPSIVFLCLPNNPLGECFDRDEVYDLISSFDSDTLIVADCAYMEYAAHKDEKKRIDAKELIERFPNAIFLGTFSKAYGLGGMRIGYGIANEEIMSALYKTRPPFNVTNLSAMAALAALDDEEFLKQSIETNFSEMKRYEEFADKCGMEFIPSFTNFITLKTGQISSSELSDRLLRMGIIVRNLKSYGLNAIRVTIGTKEQNDKFFTAYEAAHSSMTR